MGGQDGVYPRLNGGLIQTNQYNGMLASVVGKLISQNTLQTADGTNITLDTGSIEGGIVVNPDMAIEIVGTVQDATTVVAFVSRELSVDVDLGLYDKMLTIQGNPKFQADYFATPVEPPSN